MTYNIYVRRGGTWVEFPTGELCLTTRLYAMTSRFFLKNSGKDTRVMVSLTDLSTSSLHELADDLEKLSTKIRRFADSTR